MLAELSGASRNATGGASTSAAPFPQPLAAGRTLRDGLIFYLYPFSLLLPC